MFPMFAAFLQQKKVVQLDDLSAHFNLKIHEVVERIESLQEDGTINGTLFLLRLFILESRTYFLHLSLLLFYLSWRVERTFYISVSYLAVYLGS